MSLMPQPTNASTPVSRRPVNTWRAAGLVITLALTGGLLAGCETPGAPPSPLAELSAYTARNRTAADKPHEARAQAPASRASVAMECWSKVEKSRPGATIDARADFVESCIEERMKAAAGKPAT